MGPKKVVLKKAHFYSMVIGIGFLLPLMGDQFRLTPAAPAPQARPKPIPINPDDWQSLASAVRRQARGFRGDVGFIIKDLGSGHLVEAKSDHVFRSASLIKVPIMCAAFQAIQEGKLSLTQTITLQRSDRRGGSGVLKFAQPGTVFTNRELLEEMIIHSDNTATELVVKQLGYDYLQATFEKLGLQDTTIHPNGFKLSSRKVRDDNMTSPRDMAYLLEKIYRRELVSAEASDQMLDILKHQHLRDRLPKFLPTGWQIAHKTGLLRKTCHDVGIVFSPRGDYMICVLTADDATYRSAKSFIASMGRITYDYYQSGFKPVLHTRLPDRQARRSNTGSKTS